MKRIKDEMDVAAMGKQGASLCWGIICFFLELRAGRLMLAWMVTASPLLVSGLLEVLGLVDC